MTLTDEGYTALRTADFLKTIRDDFKTRLADLGLPSDIDFDRDVFLGVFTAVIADRLGEVSEFTQVLFDQFDRNNATGLFLDNLGILVGVPRREATFSTVDQTCTGTDGTIILTGALIRDDDGQGWVAIEDGTIGDGGPGTVDIIFQAVEVGAVVALAGTIEDILTPVDGWTGTTNAANASVGRAREIDDEYRLRQQQSTQSAGVGTVGATLANLSALPFVTHAVVVDNPSGVAIVKGGIPLSPYAAAVIIFPSTLTTAQKEEVARVIYQSIGMSTPLEGTDEIWDVTKADGGTQTVRWDYADTVDVTTLVTVTLDTGFVLADVDTPIEEAVTALFATLQVGQELQDLDVLQIVDVEGVKRAVVTLNGGTGVTPNLDELLVELTTTVTT